MKKIIENKYFLWSMIIIIYIFFIMYDFIGVIKSLLLINCIFRIFLRVTYY